MKKKIDVTKIREIYNIKKTLSENLDNLWRHRIQIDRYQLVYYLDRNLAKELEELKQEIYSLIDISLSIRENIKIIRSRGYSRFTSMGTISRMLVQKREGKQEYSSSDD